MKQFHLRKTEAGLGEDEVVRAEKLKRLHGAVSLEERQNRMGQYFGVKWDGPPGRESEPVRLVFEFQQAATGSTIRRAEHLLPGTATGKAEFRVIGPAYLKGGRVLAWRLRMFRSGDEVAVKRSYLWE
ncbi:MAG: hypothetical protein HKO57_13665 [Akkermansiaceae bacterium]|nr:hypothetical protein [Akkermansiaceae bacterium]